MILAPFQLHKPATLAEALTLAAEHGPDADFLAGGTDLLQQYKNRLNHRGHVISLSDVVEMRGVSPERIGAMERLSDLSIWLPTREQWPGLAEAITHVASPLIRNQAQRGR